MYIVIFDLWISEDYELIKFISSIEHNSARKEV